MQTLTYGIGVFLCYPLGIIMNALPYGHIRHLASLFFGVFLLQFTLGALWIHQLVSSLVAFILLLLLPRRTAVWVVPTFAMTYCVLGHLHPQYVNYLGWDLDFTGPQMVLTQKLYMIAFNLYDAEVLANGTESRATKKCAEFALPTLPSLTEYLGYTFCFSNILLGPAYEFTIYNNACEGSLLYTPDGRPRGMIPSNIWPTLRPLLLCLVHLGIYVIGSAYVPLLDPVDPQKNVPVILRPEFLEKPWHWRYGYMWIAQFVLRQRYYFGWKNAEGANNIWYAGFEGFDDNGKVKGWGHSNNLEFFKVEMAPSISSVSREWNKKTSLWLTRYVYIRTNANLTAVYLTSAFWHGFYPGYYLFFLSVPLVTHCGRVGKKKISPYFPSDKWGLYRIACIIATSVVIQYFVSAHFLASLEWSLRNWRSHYFFGHIGCIIFYIIVSQIPTPKSKTE